MKRTTGIILMAASALLPGTAFAAGELTDVSYSPDPAETQASLSKIMVRFSDAASGISGNVDVSGITLSRRDSPEVLYALPDPAVDYSRLYLEFAYKGDTDPVTVTTSGVYTLHVPAGAVTALNNGGTNAELNVDFTVDSEAETPMTSYTLVPAAGEVEEIATVQIAFPNAGGLDWFYNDLYGKGNFSAITLTDKAHPDVKYTAVKKAFAWQTDALTLAFVDADGNETAVTAPGTYVLNIPAGMFLKEYTEIKNREITAEYVIKGAVPEEFADMISSPADGGTVGRMRTLSLTFPHMPDGLEYPVPEAGKVTIKTPGEEGAVYYGFSAQVKSSESGQLNTFQVYFAPADASASIENALTFTQAGEYEVTVPAGVLKAYGRDVVNPDITLKFTIDPMLDFTYGVTPAPETVHGAFEPFAVTAGISLENIAVREDTGLEASISLGETSYALTSAQTDEKTVTFTMPADAVAVPGDWRVEIPAGYFEGLNKDGVTIINQEPVEFTYAVKEAEQFGYTVEPAEGATVEFFKNVTLLFEGANLKQVSIDAAAGTPELVSADGHRYILSGRVSGKYAIFTVDGGVSLPDGLYEVTVPAGYIRTMDADRLTAAVPEVKSSFTVRDAGSRDYTDGILFLNEGWYGHDTGSLNFLGSDGQWTYDAFLRSNPDRRLGITSQYAQCFGDRIYVVSKQAGEESGIKGGQLTVVDASTLSYQGQIYEVPDTEAQPRAFCAWDAHKGYLSTDKQIYAIDLDNLEVKSVVPGTDVFTSFNSNGEMLRYGDRIFAIRQSTGVDVIDPATDDVTTVAAELAEAFAVTPDGSLYVATRNETTEFIKISPVAPYEMEIFDIDADRAKITNVWSTWRKAPLAADVTRNAVYYVTEMEASSNPRGARAVAKYDFDTRTFTENFIILPGKADGLDADWVLYGEGVSVNPADGMILLTAVEAGNYSRNKVFVADPATGDILGDETIDLESGYWFPAMTLYPDFSAPVIDAASLTLPDGPCEFTVSMPEITTLRVGNAHLVNYSVESDDYSACEVTAAAEPGLFTVKVPGNFSYGLKLTADYQGKIAEAVVSHSASVGTLTDGARIPEVCNMQGVVVLRDATVEDINRLEPGIYVAGARKYVVK